MDGTSKMPTAVPMEWASTFERNMRLLDRCESQERRAHYALPFSLQKLINCTRLGVMRGLIKEDPAHILLAKARLDAARNRKRLWLASRDAVAVVIDRQARNKIKR